MSPKPAKLTREAARTLILKHQLLLGARKKGGKRGALAAIRELGYIQIDTINVVERAHHLTLLSRIPDYRRHFLSELQADQKSIFEYWAHAASFLPIEDYRYYLSCMERHRNPEKGSWLERWTGNHKTLLFKVRQRIEKEGALAASDFRDEPGRKRGTWWDWKPAKAALEILFWRGELMVKERRNFQRVYDLTERVLPQGVDTSRPSEREEKRFFIKRALRAMGLAAAQDINRYIGISGKLNPWIRDMERLGEIVPVALQGSKRRYCMLSSTRLPRRRATTETVHLLSPFDNAIILRDRTEDLFDFSYRLECYLPKEKRKYGYLCLPILWGNRLVGRIDPKADRKTNILLINNLHLEHQKLLQKEFLVPFSTALSRLAALCGCTSISLARTVDRRTRKALSSYF